MDYISDLPSNHTQRERERERGPKENLSSLVPSPSQVRRGYCQWCPKPPLDTQPHRHACKPLHRSIPHPHRPIPCLPPHRPTSIDPYLVLTNPSIVLTNPPPLTHLSPFFSLKTHLLSFPSRSRILWGCSYSFFLHDLVGVITIICYWLQSICFCLDLLVLGKVLTIFLENVLHANPNTGNTFSSVFYITQPNK